MALYNPRLHITATSINADGIEEPLGVDLFPANLSNVIGNRPAQCSVSIQKTLSGTQQSCNISLSNAPIAEDLRNNFEALFSQLENVAIRVRVYAWYQDNDQYNLPPFDPIFVGDSFEDFDLRADSVTDSTFTINANGHDFLQRAGKRNNGYDRGTSYRAIVEDTFNYFAGLGYNRGFIIQDQQGILANKFLKRKETNAKNPVEYLNEICRDLDFVWGVDGLRLYIMKRDEFIEVPLNDTISAGAAEIDESRGLISVPSQGLREFSFNSLWDNNLTIGRRVLVSDEPQTKFKNQFVGRINSMSISLNNYEGHTVQVSCQRSTPDGLKVRLPVKKDDYSGRRL